MEIAAAVRTDIVSLERYVLINQMRNLIRYDMLQGSREKARRRTNTWLSSREHKRTHRTCPKQHQFPPPRTDLDVKRKTDTLTHTL